jgi:Ser-tRNA(Ala) deacylase AlaX
MGKIKNDFQHWIGVNKPDVLRRMRSMRLNDWATIVEEYIIHTYTRLKEMETAKADDDADDDAEADDGAEEQENKMDEINAMLESLNQTAERITPTDDLDSIYPNFWSDEDFEKLKKTLGESNGNLIEWKKYLGM